MQFQPIVRPNVDPKRHQRTLLRIVLVVMFVFSVLIGSLNVFLFQAYQVGTYNFISAAASVIIWFYYQATRNLKFASWLLTFAVIFNLSAFIVSAKGAAYSIIWVTVLPPLAFFLLGRRAGSWVTGIAFVATIAFLIINLPDLPVLAFTTGTILNITEVLIILWLIFRFYEGSRQSAYQELERLSVVDKLTGLYNRAKLDDLLEANIHLSSRTSLPLVVMLLDIDHFKRINDQYGHVEGDAVLQQVAVTLSKRVRSTDVLGRWGGEEFLLICPATRLSEGLQLADMLRQHVADDIKRATDPLTLSIGVTEVCRQIQPNDVIRQADSALYKAKNSGRNRVVHFTEERPVT
ncbi:MAG: GGDEF domain-containing protein [Aliidiomarina sp.]|uniref:GGDEF domain-containing protein n=1 Tax=Aliidiomarina sp. TaxID=1872439 RepID=UPI0025B816F5|nr:GGDEF domain-containing protein [Aliidiomarina sp.]MCH8500820.1 GGDEF domain-containing protein [Aliidiomarina sp.]